MAVWRENRKVAPSDDFEIEFRWKEEVVYWEGKRGFLFDGGWGVDPLETYVPSSNLWDAVVPAWLVGRRDEVVERLRADTGHVVRDDPGFLPGDHRDVLRD